MRLITYSSGPNASLRIGVRVGHRVLDIDLASRVDGEPLPANRKALLREGRGALSRVQALARAAQLNAGRFASALVEERAIRFLPPVPDADHLLGVMRNYPARVDEQSSDPRPSIAGEPTTFVKLNLPFGGHNARVARPGGVVRLDCQPELVFVIGKAASNVSTDDAQEYVVGVTLLGRLTNGDLPQAEPGDSPHALAIDTLGFGLLGPEIVTMDEIIDPYDLWLTCAVNGEERMRVNTREQIWQLADILAHFSRSVAIEPGDLLSTGTPGYASLDTPRAKKVFLSPGDVVDCAIEGLTSLRATIVAPED